MQWHSDKEPSRFINGVVFLHYNSFISESSCPTTHPLTHWCGAAVSKKAKHSARWTAFYSFSKPLPVLIKKPHQTPALLGHILAYCESKR